jgi:hypothetical protein
MRLLCVVLAALRIHEDPADKAPDGDLRSAEQAAKAEIQKSAGLFDRTFKPKVQAILDAEKAKIATLTGASTALDSDDKKAIEALGDDAADADASSFIELDDGDVTEKLHNQELGYKESIEKFHQLNSHIKEMAERNQAEYLKNFAPNAASSLLQTIDNSTPEDGFAKVEAKLKALQEKIKADTAKFEQEAKAAPSSFAQVSESPDDGFAKVEAKLKALQEKIKADTAKFEQEAKAAPSSFAQVSETPTEGMAAIEKSLKSLERKLKSDTSRIEDEGEKIPSSFAETTPKSKLSKRHLTYATAPLTTNEQQDEDVISSFERKLKKKEEKYALQETIAKGVLKEFSDEKKPKPFDPSTDPFAHVDPDSESTASDGGSSGIETVSDVDQVEASLRKH